MLKYQLPFSGNVDTPPSDPFNPDGKILTWPLAAHLLQTKGKKHVDLDLKLRLRPSAVSDPSKPWTSQVFAIVLYDTEIVRIYPDGSYVMTTGGFTTSITLRTLNSLTGYSWRMQASKLVFVANCDHDNLGANGWPIAVREEIKREPGGLLKINNNPGFMDLLVYCRQPSLVDKIKPADPTQPRSGMVLLNPEGETYIVRRVSSTKLQLQSEFILQRYVKDYGSDLDFAVVGTQWFELTDLACLSLACWTVGERAKPSLYGS